MADKGTRFLCEKDGKEGTPAVSGGGAELLTCCHRSPVHTNVVPPPLVGTLRTKFCWARVVETSCLPPYRQPCPGVGSPLNKGVLDDAFSGTQAKSSGRTVHGPMGCFAVATMMPEP